MQKELLDILACPRCHGDVTLQTEKSDADVQKDGVQQDGVQKNVGLTCAACAVMYPIRDDIPIMLLEEAVPLSPEQNKEKETPCASS